MIEASSGTINNMLQAGDVMICSRDHFQGVYNYINAMDRCVALPTGGTWKSARSLRQSKGALCTYYIGEHDCSIERMNIASPSRDVELNMVAPIVADHVTRVRCEPYGIEDSEYV